MARYALIITATGAVDNVIEYDGSAPFTPPTGQELRVADANAEPGGTWNGSAFVRAPAYVPTRTEVLMNEVTNPVASYDADGDPVNKTADVVAAEKLELRNLLLAELQAGDLAQDRTQTLLRLERE
tara:strand:+ start:2929 stop:3306 length:378 start_codon:yes stop_codon:yes gene_type:complete